MCSGYHRVGVRWLQVISGPELWVCCAWLAMFSVFTTHAQKRAHEWAICAPDLRTGL